MRLFASLILLAGLCLHPGLARADDAASIRQALADWTAAFNARDAEGACRLFAPDLVARFRGQPPRGRDAICGGIARLLADERVRATNAFDIEEIIVAGDLAVVRLVWTQRILRDGRETVSREPGLDVFRRGPDDAWRIIRYLAYSEERDE